MREKVAFDVTHSGYSYVCTYLTEPKDEALIEIRRFSAGRMMEPNNTKGVHDMPSFQVRQGDVFLQRVPRRRALGASVPGERVILAYGEATGHAHEVVSAEAEATTIPPAQLFEAPDGTRYLLVDRPSQLVHAEHGAIALTPGAYRVTTQREYSPEAIRSVRD